MGLGFRIFLNSGPLMGEGGEGGGGGICRHENMMGILGPYVGHIGITQGTHLLCVW